MEWAIRLGGWHAHRLSAIDAVDQRQHFFTLPNPLQAGTPLPGLIRSQEPLPSRRTNRAELACLASWKRMLLTARQMPTPSGWLLLMEDDVGSSLAAPDGWIHSLLELIESCPKRTLAIQLSPINAAVRQQLADHWKDSRGLQLSVPKEAVRSHGNGAVLLHRNALRHLTDLLGRLCKNVLNDWHPLIHPWRIRPVADKWLYGSLPTGSCRVATYPHFCLEAEDSFLHQEHVKDFHQPSRDVTLSTWARDHRNQLLSCQRNWDSIRVTT